MLQVSKRHLPHGKIPLDGVGRKIRPVVQSNGCTEGSFAELRTDQRTVRHNDSRWVGLNRECHALPLTALDVKVLRGEPAGYLWLLYRPLHCGVQDCRTRNERRGGLCRAECRSERHQLMQIASRGVDLQLGTLADLSLCGQSG